MRKTFKYRLYPHKQQQRLLEQQLEECRWLYTELLAARRDAWEQRQDSLRLYDQQATLPLRKAARPTLAAVQSPVLQHVVVRIDRAFQAFFRRVRAGETPGYPRFRGSTLCQDHLSARPGRLQPGHQDAAAEVVGHRTGEDH